jgi:CRP/FNR family cyclic AMP-dependent transcriptional regulator
MGNALFILGELSDRDVDWMIATGRRERVAAGTVLIREGEAVETVYAVLEGTLSVSVGAQGDRQVARLGSGEIVGEMSFVDARPPSATVRALDDALVLAVPRPQLAAKLERERDFAARFYRAIALILSHRLRETNCLPFLGSEPQLAAVRDDADELDDNVLDKVHLAGMRFERVRKRATGQGGTSVGAGPGDRLDGPEGVNGP